MIEIIYKGEEEALNDEINIRLPKNIRQIGECEHYSHKIYVEDFVMTYVKHFSSQKLKYGVLLGDIKRGNGNTYIFITGAVTANAILDNEILFDEDVWTGIYEEIKMYFEEVEIVGWFAPCQVCCQITCRIYKSFILIILQAMTEYVFFWTGRRGMKTFFCMMKAV